MSLVEGICIEIVLLQMNMDPGPVLLEDLRVSDVASEKVTVVLIAEETWGIRGKFIFLFFQKQRMQKCWPIPDEMMKQLKHNSGILFFLIFTRCLQSLFLHHKLHPSFRIHDASAPQGPSLLDQTLNRVK